MKPKRAKKKFIVLLVLLIMAAPVVLIFFQRPPALVVTDASFLALYGTGRLRLQMVVSSLTLFRPVKPVLIADSVSADVLALAVQEASPRPYGVLFSHRFIEAAKLCHEQMPGVPIMLMEGRIGNAKGTEDFWVFKTDRETDCYRAGLAAGIIAGEEPQRIVVFQDRSADAAERNAFVQGLRDQGLETEPSFYYLASQLTDTKDISCVVLMGAGTEIMDRNLKVPVILCTWLDPALTSHEIVLIFDDSPWALAVPALAMAVKEPGEQLEGKIPSKPLVFSGRIADNRISRDLTEAVKKQYERP